MNRGWFITFEGPDGSGKTTISSSVYKQLQIEGFDVIYTREPGGIEIAEQIRDVILDPKNTKMDVKTEALLYAASRRQHLVEKILPALEDHKIVICDRFVDSSLAYQGVGRKIGLEPVLAINEFAIEGRYPDFTIFLDLDPSVGLERIKNREHLDRLDLENEHFHQLVGEGYEQLKERFKDRYYIVDVNRPLEAIVADAIAIIKEKVT